MKILDNLRRKKQDLTAKDALRLVLWLQEKQQDMEEMERACGHEVQANIHKHKRHALHDYQLQLEKMMKQGKKISA